MTRRREPISIWEPRAIDGEAVFVRPDPLALGDHSRGRQELRPKTSELPLRVAFFGESAAAGYLYAPHLTPARVLESQLRSAGGESNFEVIDLARTNETLASLAETVRTSLQINPDVLAIFVGNNWNLLETPEVSPYAPSIPARREGRGSAAGGRNRRPRPPRRGAPAGARGGGAGADRLHRADGADPRPSSSCPR